MTAPLAVGKNAQWLWFNDAQRDAIGLNDGLGVGHYGYSVQNSRWERCTAVQPTSSTWTGGAPTLDVLSHTPPLNDTDTASKLRTVCVKQTTINGTIAAAALLAPDTDVHGLIYGYATSWLNGDVTKRYGIAMIGQFYWQGSTLTVNMSAQTAQQGGGNTHSLSIIAAAEFVTLVVTDTVVEDIDILFSYSIMRAEESLTFV